MFTEAIGWCSAFILLLTIGKQVYKQWKEGRSEGVSKWLFIGQLAASTGFTAYSWLLHNWVFVVTNALILLSAVIGEMVFLRNRKKESQKKSG